MSCSVCNQSFLRQPVGELAAIHGDRLNEEELREAKTILCHIPSGLPNNFPRQAIANGIYLHSLRGKRDLSAARSGASHRQLWPRNGNVAPLPLRQASHMAGRPRLGRNAALLAYASGNCRTAPRAALVAKAA